MADVVTINSSLPRISWIVSQPWSNLERGSSTELQARALDWQAEQAVSN